MKRAIIILFSIYSFVGNAQLDSVQVSGIFSQEIDTEDSLGVTDVFNVEITVFDIDFLGEIVIAAVDPGTNITQFVIKRSKQELLDENYLNSGVFDNTIEMPLYNLSPSMDFRLEVTARNYQGANIPIKVYNYEAH